MTENSQAETLQKLLTKLEEQAQELAELRLHLLQQQEKIVDLEGHVNPVPVAPATTSSRRKFLSKAAVLMLAGAGATATSLVTGATAQARVTSDPGAADGRVGAIILPKSTSLPGGIPPSQMYYGLVTTDGTDTTFDYSKLPYGSTGIYANGKSYGMYAQSKNYGVFGSGSAAGVTGNGYNGVVGQGTVGVSGNGTDYGVQGWSNLIAVAGYGGNYGLLGSGKYYGVYGSVFDPNGYSGYFSGKVHVLGTLSKGGGSFKIDHPLDPANKYLSHSFVESPDMLNIYNGVVELNAKGEATITLPDWFEALNRDFRYQLTSIGDYAPVYISQKVKDNTFKIAGGKSGQEISWQITGIRQDKWANANRIPVEEEKSLDEKGKYLHPQLHGAGEARQIGPNPLKPEK